MPVGRRCFKLQNGLFPFLQRNQQDHTRCLLWRTCLLSLLLDRFLVVLSSLLTPSSPRLLLTVRVEPYEDCVNSVVLCSAFNFGQIVFSFLIVVGLVMIVMSVLRVLLALAKYICGVCCLSGSNPASLPVTSALMLRLIVCLFLVLSSFPASFTPSFPSLSFAP
jgi:hypothetical protein